MSAGRQFPPIVLIGMMGAGKSTIGRALAELLRLSFVDLDRELERRCGVSIPCIFDAEGEDGFRKRETELLKEYLGKPNTIIATGGGVVVRLENRELLKQSQALSVHLTILPEQCYERTRMSDRPLLQCENPLETIRFLIKTRTPYYQEVAALTYSTDGKTVQEGAIELAEQIQKRLTER